MSDTSIVSTVSTYKKGFGKTSARDDSDEQPSCWGQYWFQVISIFLSLVIIITSSVLIFVLYKQAELHRQRQRIKDEFKRKHGVANKVLDMIVKDGPILNILKLHSKTLATSFKELMTDMVETLFNE